MWWVRSRRVEVYLGESLVGWRAAGEAAARWRDTSTVDGGLAVLAGWCAEDAAPKRLRVWLGSSLAQPWMLPADAGVRSRPEARALATAMAPDTTSWAEAPKVWTAPWRDGQATACVAMPGRIASALLVAGAAKGASIAHVESVRPWWNQALDEALARSRADRVPCGWSLAEPDGLVCGLASDGRLDELRFEASKRHDANWTLLRRRLAINWPAGAAIDHRRFAREQNPAYAIASAVAVAGEEMAA